MEIKVPDIGNISNVDVIEVLVKKGDKIQEGQSLITLESDKSSVEIPAPSGGVVQAMKVKVGDKVSMGDVILDLEDAVPSSTQAGAIEKVPTQPEEGAHSKVDGEKSDKSVDEGTLAKSGEKAQIQSKEEVQIKSKGDAQTKSEAVPASSSLGLSSSQSAQSFHSSTGQAVSASPPGGAAKHADIECDMLVLGAGPGGYSAAFRAADLGMKTVLVERYATLGGVCLNVGCIPSKALLHVTAVMNEARALANHGITFGEPRVDLKKLVHFKEKVVNKLTGGLASMASMRRVTVITGNGAFVDPNYLSVQAADGTTQTIYFKQAIIATGSQAIRLPFMPEDKRIVDSTGALRLNKLPKKMLIVGGGIIGLEMGTVYATLGAASGTRLDVVEMLEGLMPGADRDLVKIWQKHNAPYFDHIMLKTKTVSAKARRDGIYVTFEGAAAPKEPQRYDLVLQAVGRTPNSKNIGLEKLGIALTDRGFIQVDKQMRTNLSHLFAIGDVVGQPMLAHKAVHEGHVAAEAAAGKKSFFDARVIPAVAYTDPEVAWVGLTENEAQQQGIKIEKSIFPWAASGRAIANGRDEGCTKLIFDPETQRILGGGIVGTHAGDLISELALAVEMNADVVDIAKTIHPHPTLSESIGMAAEVAEGTCTDLPPGRKR